VPQLLLKRTTTQNAPAGLSAGEAAWSENGFLYIGRADGSVVPIAQVQGVFRPATEALFAGAFVNLWTNNGMESVRLANAGTGLPAHGYVTQAIASGANAFVCTTEGGINRQASVAASGALATGDYVLSTEAGKIIAAANAPASPTLYQSLGMASGSDFIFAKGLVVWR
jgi:hypothetical protein